MMRVIGDSATVPSLLLRVRVTADAVVLTVAVSLVTTIVHGSMMAMVRLLNGPLHLRASLACCRHCHRRSGGAVGSVAVDVIGLVSMITAVDVVRHCRRYRQSRSSSPSR